MKGYLKKISGIFRSGRILIYIPLIGIFFWFFSMIIVGIDINFTYRWIVLVLYLFSLLFISAPFFLRKAMEFKWRRVLSQKEILLFGLVFLLAIISRFALLRTYPFVSVGDEVRDGGLNTLKIVNGDIKNIFEYGSYRGYGLIIPTLVVPFFHFFGNSVLTYRFFSAILGVFDIVLIYLIIRITLGKLPAVIGSVVFICLPLHLYYSRTHTVVIFDSFLSSLIFFCLLIFFRYKNTYGYILLGLVLGFSFNFHSSARVFSLLVLAIVVLREITSIFYKSSENKKTIYKKILFLLFFCLIGFGPRLWFTDMGTFFHLSRFNNSIVLSIGSLGKLADVLGRNYFKSLLVWFYEPTTSFATFRKPVFPLFYIVFFILGALYLLKTKNKYLLVVSSFVFIVPFTHSTLTDSINNDHRIMSMIPSGIILLTAGFVWLFLRFKNKYLTNCFAFFIFVYSAVSGYLFFSERLANRRWNKAEVLSMHIINTVKINYKNERNLCLISSPATADIFRLLHHKEQFEYFLNSYSLEILPDYSVSDNEVIISGKNCGKNKERVLRITCDGRPTFCPENFVGELNIFY